VDEQQQRKDVEHLRQLAILGVFTLVVLTRDSVVDMYAAKPGP